MPENAKYKKEYISVDVVFSADGAMLPRYLKWENGKTYKIDRVLNIHPAPAQKAGGQGDRYTVMIGEKERSLFFEHNPDIESRNIGKWFVERRVE